MGKEHLIKTIPDRLKETIHLLKEIQGVGISDTDPSYNEVKKYLDDWIRSDKKQIQEFTIDFVRFGKKGVLTLPWRADRACEFSLKIVKKKN